MEDLKKQRQKRLRDGFADLLIEGCSIKTIPGFECCELDQHPFGLQLPKVPNWEHRKPDIYYVGHPGHTEASVRGIIRMVAWAITNSCLGNHDPVHFLRVINAETDEPGSKHHRLYYEIGVRERLFMAGGCTDYSGEGGYGAKQMDKVMFFLSSTYGTPVNQHSIPFDRAEKIYRTLDDILYTIHKDQKKHELERREKEKNYQHFEVGQFVALTSEWVRYCGEQLEKNGKSKEPEKVRVLKAETLINQCTCGLGMDPSISIVLHPEMRCSLRRRFEACHHQLVTVKIGGQERSLSGHYLTALVN